MNSNQKSRRRFSPRGGHEPDELLWPRRIWRQLAGKPEALPERELLRHLAQGHSLHEAARWVSRLKDGGWLSQEPRGRLRLLEIEGELRMNARGFGFVVGETPPDVFIPERALAGAMHGDLVTVWVRENPEGKGPEGRIMEIRARGLKQVVGSVVRQHGRWVVRPSDERLPAVAVGHGRGRLSYQPGTIVVAEIVGWPAASGESPRGRVTEVLGRPGQTGVDVRVVMAEHGVPGAFPPAVVAAAAALPRDVRRPDWKGRKDLTGDFIVTIDGADAKDLDDAVSVETLPDGWRVGVHIADVSFYVDEHGPIDQEARKRGTSVYLVDRVIPMLPEELSNQIASLNPGVPRLTVSAWITLSRQGEVRRVDFARSVIKTRHRLTYEAVNRALAGEADELSDIREWFVEANHVAEVLHRQRVRRGAIDFDLPEAKVELGPDGSPTGIVARHRGLAERLIEEFMLLANEAVAATLLKAELPGLFRVHEEPAAEKLDDFRTLAGALGHRLPERVAPKDLQKLLDRVRGTPEELVVTGALLRAMRQARYAAESLGHFGLATEHYTHFTSPIRRYPDLFVHRVLTAWMAGRLTPAARRDWAREAPEVALVSSERERAAMEAERDSVLVKQVQFMADKVGEEFSGVVSGVTGFGLFVSLEVMVEGMIRLEDLPHDTYRADPVHQTLTGGRSGRVYRLGDPIRVQVARVDQAARRIDLVPAPDLAPPPSRPTRAPARGRRRKAPVGSSR
jgi:ribonuclease R